MRFGRSVNFAFMQREREHIRCLVFGAILMIKFADSVLADEIEREFESGISELKRLRRNSENSIKKFRVIVAVFSGIIKNEVKHAEYIRLAGEEFFGDLADASAIGFAFELGHGRPDNLAHVFGGGGTGLGNDLLEFGFDSGIVELFRQV